MSHDAELTNQDEDIYNEIELEDLRGPAVDNTIRLDVQDQDDWLDEEDSVARGIILGKTPDELLSITQDHLESTRSLEVEFTNVCVPNPITLRPPEMVDRPPTEEEQPALDFFHHQRDASMFAINVVKDLHLASNAENADHGEFPSAAFSSFLPSFALTPLSSSFPLMSRCRRWCEVQLTSGRSSPASDIAADEIMS